MMGNEQRMNRAVMQASLEHYMRRKSLSLHTEQSKPAGGKGKEIMGASKGAAFCQGTGLRCHNIRVGL